MATDDDIHNSLTAIYSRLGVIDGKATLTVRAYRDPILQALEELIGDKPLVGQIYLLLDGKRSQREIRLRLSDYGIDKSEATISRHVERAVDHGIAELVEESGSSGKIYRREANMEKILALSKNVRKWLTAKDQVVPEEKNRDRKRKK